MRIGILCLGRATFDVAFASEKLDALLAVLDATGHEIVGPRAVLLDAGATRAAITDLGRADIDRLLLLQVTFTDASMTVAAARAIKVPLSIWAVPEPRLGGRLRLNAFCGLNLASHALGLIGRGFSWLYADPGAVGPEDLSDLLDGLRPAGQLAAASVAVSAEMSAMGREIADRIAGKRIACIGEHPEGFDTCAYSAETVSALAGVTVEALPLDAMFEAARASDDAGTERARNEAAAVLVGLDAVESGPLDRSLRLKSGLESIREAGRYDAFAIRCWPETFTEYGGAVCGPVSMLGEAGVPCACEADVYGALTQLILQEVAQSAVFLTDLIDVDVNDGTAVVWHCGQAPASMRDPDVPAVATIHANRKMPLLYEFPLKPGRVTLMRISQAFGEPKMVLAAVEVLRRPIAFSGTSGVLRFDRPADEVLGRIIASGLEHHMALAYGDHLDGLRGVAVAMKLPLLEL